MLALICGTGDLPRLIAEAQAERPLVCVLDGFAPEGLAADVGFRLERLGSLLQDLTARGVTRVCFCGAIRRPAIDPSLIDAATLPLVPVLQAAMAQGDDGALRAVISVFEEAGFAVQGADRLLPELLAQAGVATRAQPEPRHRADVQEALLALAEMGARDEGQAVVVRAGRVVAREGPEGTDAMLAGLTVGGSEASGAGDPLDWIVETSHDMLQGAAEWLSDREDAALRESLVGGILYKGPKPGQERRADLPTIGPGTARAVVAARLDGIVIEAGGVLVVDPGQVVEILDAAGRFLWVRAR